MKAAAGGRPILYRALALREGTGKDATATIRKQCSQVGLPTQYSCAVTLLVGELRGAWRSTGAKGLTHDPRRLSAQDPVCLVADPRRPPPVD